MKIKWLELLKHKQNELYRLIKKAKYKFELLKEIGVMRLELSRPVLYIYDSSRDERKCNFNSSHRSHDSVGC